MLTVQAVSVALLMVVAVVGVAGWVVRVDADARAGTADLDAGAVLVAAADNAEVVVDAVVAGAAAGTTTRVGVDTVVLVTVAVADGRAAETVAVRPAACTRAYVD